MMSRLKNELVRRDRNVSGLGGGGESGGTGGNEEFRTSQRWRIMKLRCRGEEVIQDRQISTTCPIVRLSNGGSVHRPRRCLSPGAHIFSSRTLIRVIFFPLTPPIVMSENVNSDMGLKDAVLQPKISGDKP